MIKGNRPLNVLLITCLIVIWTFVIKKAFFQNNSEAIIENQSGAYEFPRETVIKNKDTIHLAQLENPFLNTSVLTIKNKKNNTSTKKRILFISEEKFSWPSIQYYGIVGRNEGKDLRGLIKFDNKMIRLKVGDVQGNIQIRHLYPDSLVLFYNKYSKTVKRLK